MLKFKQKIPGKIADGGKKDVEIMVALQYLSNFWRILEMVLINCEINLIVTWSEKSMLSNDTKATFAITDTKRYVPVVTLSTQVDTKLIQQIKSGFERTINGNKYQSKVSIQMLPNPHLDYLIIQVFRE